VSSIITDQGSVHYEVFGRGRPVILLHGWLGSWGLWHDTMDYLSRTYRTYALDFWGFGESDKKRDSYAVQDFISLVDQFMEQMGINSAPLVGHSMGGTVSLSVAIMRPERVSKVVVIGSPIDGSSLSLLLKLAGIRTIAWLVYHTMWALKLGIQIASPLITRDRGWPDMINQDLSRVTLESFLMSIASLRRTDLRPQLAPIGQPVLGMYGDRDVIVNPNQWAVLKAGAPNTLIERYHRAGHFIMLDEPKKFMTSLKGFLDYK
jgi:pimeloyl-ACP methyl ester carboxylesterase